MKKYFLAIFMLLISFSSYGQMLTEKESKVYNETFIECTKEFEYRHQVFFSRDILQQSPQEALKNLKNFEKKRNELYKKSYPKYDTSFSNAQLKKIVNDVYFGRFKYSNINSIPNSSSRYCEHIAATKAYRSQKNWQPLK